MESSAAVHTDAGGFASAGESPGRRLLLLAGAVIVPFAAAFAIGAATKSTPSSTHGGASLAPAVTLGASHASVTAPKLGVAVPALKAVPKKHVSSSQSSGTSVSQSNNTAVTQPPPVNTSQSNTSQSNNTVVTPPPPPPHPTKTVTGGGSGTGLSTGGG